MHVRFWWGDLMEGDHLKDLGVDGWIILKWIFKNRNGGMDQIHVTQDRDRWGVFVNAIMNLRIP